MGKKSLFHVNLNRFLIIQRSLLKRAQTTARRVYSEAIII